jgi:hypothetical protein
VKPEARALSLPVPEAGVSVGALWIEPPAARAGLVLAHGAGAGMRHRFLEQVAVGLAERGIATLRFQFGYMERGSKRPDPPALAVAAVRSAVAEAARLAPALPWFAGGKSFGGRMTSTAQAQAALPGVRGIVFFGFPLHPAGKPSVRRSEHLARVSLPMLFLQGTRDELADAALVREVHAGLGERARLVWFDDADHAFHVRAASGNSDAAVMQGLVDAAARWMVETLEHA